ncbi:hypothetical protein CEXT_611 [Caerostris extrusa]|uniref:Ionotropic receptor n=1 Tax=Caerostris extrusa TaxID=172846 RepID=A0AAV4RV94_CAEEX|nr:hypothetical protein CEXT_611 [Caerostris extrusa]
MRKGLLEWVPYIDPVIGKDNKSQLGGVAKDAYDAMKTFMMFKHGSAAQPVFVAPIEINFNRKEQSLDNMIHVDRNSQILLATIRVNERLAIFSNYVEGKIPFSGWQAYGCCGNGFGICHEGPNVYGITLLWLSHSIPMELKSPNGTWSGMIGTMMSNETDISGPYFVSEERSLCNGIYCSFSLFATDFAVRIGFKQQRSLSHSGCILRNGEVWITLLLTTIVVSATATLIYYVLPARNKRKKKLKLFQDTYGHFSQVYQEKMVRETCKIIAKFHSSPEPVVHSVLPCHDVHVPGCDYFHFHRRQTEAENFQHRRVASEYWNRNQHVQRFISNGFFFSKPEVAFKRDRPVRTVSMVRTGTVPSWLDAVEEGKEVFIADTLWMKKNLVGERFLKTGKCGIRAIDVDLGAAYIAFAFRKQLKNSSVFKNFNKGMRRFNEGDLSKFKILISTVYYDICTSERMSVTDPLNLSDLAGAFIILAMGNAFSLILFVFEYLKRNRKKR